MFSAHLLTSGCLCCHTWKVGIIMALSQGLVIRFWWSNTCKGLRTGLSTHWAPKKHPEAQRGLAILPREPVVWTWLSDYRVPPPHLWGLLLLWAFYECELNESLRSPAFVEKGNYIWGRGMMQLYLLLRNFNILQVLCPGVLSTTTRSSWILTWIYICTFHFLHKTGRLHKTSVSIKSPVSSIPPCYLCYFEPVNYPICAWVTSFVILRTWFLSSLNSLWGLPSFVSWVTCILPPIQWELKTYKTHLLPLPLATYLQ